MPLIKQICWDNFFIFLIIVFIVFIRKTGPMKYRLAVSTRGCADSLPKMHGAEMKGRSFVTKRVVVLVLGAALLVSALNCVVVRPADSGKRRTTADHNNINTNQLLSCFTRRLDGYWDFATHSIHFRDEYCEMETVVQEPSMPDPTAVAMNGHTQANLFERLQGSCILLFGDSTDRQITESWCPRWMEGHVQRKDKAIQLWSPKNRTTGRSIRDHVLAGQVWHNGGLRCSPGGKFTFGSYMHYGVSAPPLWKFAHTYQTDLPHAELLWGNTTDERILHDIPRYFAECDAQGHNRHRVVVIQSYLWDLARQWFVYDTERPPPSMIHEWAVNATKLVQHVRDVVPQGTLIAWRYAGPLVADKGRDTQTISDMNAAFLAKASKDSLHLDFVADYGAILSSELTKKSGPFPAHPPALPRTAYLNLLLNAILASKSSKNSVEEDVSRARK